MAKKAADPMQSAPETPRASQKGSPLLVVLTVLLILVGVVDVFLWGLAGYYVFRGTQQSAAPNGTYADGGTPAGGGASVGGGDASDSAKKREALVAYIQQLTEVQTLESEVLGSFSSVSGTNYTDDNTMYKEVTERTVPLCQQMNEKVLKITTDDAEIGELCKMHRDYVTKLLNALTMLTSALSSQDAAQVTEANNQINAANDLAADFQLALRNLAQERNVTLSS